jgi:MFS family permease
MVFGAAVFVLRAILASLATDPIMLVAIAPLEGLGFACAFVGGVTVLASRLPASVGGTAQGLFSASTGLATIIGSVVGGTVAGAVGIHWMFAASAAIALAGAILLGYAVLGPRAGFRSARPPSGVAAAAPARGGRDVVG